VSTVTETSRNQVSAGAKLRDYNGEPSAQQLSPLPFRESEMVLMIIRIALFCQPVCTASNSFSLLSLKLALYHHKPYRCPPFSVD